MFCTDEGVFVLFIAITLSLSSVESAAILFSRAMWVSDILVSAEIRFSGTACWISLKHPACNRQYDSSCIIKRLLVAVQRSWAVAFPGCSRSLILIQFGMERIKCPFTNRSRSLVAVLLRSSRVSL